MPRFEGPDAIFGDLFEVVQSTHVFSDSKTFVDATPKYSVATINEAFDELDEKTPASMRSFVQEYFTLPGGQESSGDASVEIPVRERIEQLWDVLSRAADQVEPNSSLIALPRPYIVPGGRFREIYYWDTYFTMLGLAEAGRFDAIADIVENFAFLIDEIGFIPNGNRTYFCTRSQPPFFVLMVELLAAVRGDRSIVLRYLPQLRREYDFWMAGADTLAADGDTSDRVVRVGDGVLNRYWDESDQPRPESYAEDREYAANTGRDKHELYRDIRAACESGWDFSSRWLADAQSFGSIHTTQVIPVDLNSLLFRLEAGLAAGYTELGDTTSAKLYSRRAESRKRELQNRFFDDEAGFFVDLRLPDLQPTGVLSLAAAYPLFLGIATAQQAAMVTRRIQDEFLVAGGWLTTLNATGQQWDRPNGWAPLQWVVFEGMRNYGFSGEADIGARRWVDDNLDVYRKTGRLLEKYDAEHIGSLATGGEYAVQDGFGWTNAILLKFMNHLGIRDLEP